MRIAVEEDGGRRDDGNAILMIDGQRIAGTLHYNIYPAASYRMREFMLNLDRHPLRDAKSSIRFWTRTHGDMEIRTRAFSPAWNALQECMTNLNVGLGIKPDDIARVATQPEGSIFDFVAPSGAVDFAVLYWVTQTGTVEDCRLLKPSGNKTLDTSLCTNFQRKARFKPGLDSAGQPVRAPRFENVRIRVQTVVTTGPG